MTTENPPLRSLWRLRRGLPRDLYIVSRVSESDDSGWLELTNFFSARRHFISLAGLKKKYVQVVELDRRDEASPRIGPW